MKTNKFAPLNKYFDKIYVVSLRRSEDRHKALSERLDGLDYEFFWGVDGREKDINVLESKGLYNHELYNLNRLAKGEPIRRLNMGRVGCALSHVNIYIDIIENKISKALILEDDIIVNDSNIGTFEKGASELPDDWELLYLGHFGSNRNFSTTAKFKLTTYRILHYLGLNKYDPEIYRKIYPRPHSKHLERAGSHWGTHAYAITKQGASKILKYQNPVTREADNLLAELCKFELINAFSFKNHIFDQDVEIASTIIDHR